MLRRLLLYSYIMYLTNSQEFKLSSVFTPCEFREDFQNCFSKTIQNMFEAFGTGKTPLKIPIIEPLELTRIEVPEGGKSVNAKQIYKNVKIHGITNMTNVKADYDVLNLEFHHVSFHPTIFIASDYELKGEILKHNVKGNGALTINFQNVTMEILSVSRLIPKKSDLYFNITEATIKFLPKKAHFEFTNLKENGKSADEVINRLINDNWKEIYEDIRDSYNYAVSIGLKNWANQIAKYVTFANIFA